MEIFYMILGFVAMYVWVHFIVIQFQKAWKDRNVYEKILTIASIVFFALYFLGTVPAQA